MAKPHAKANHGNPQRTADQSAQSDREVESRDQKMTDAQNTDGVDQSKSLEDDWGLADKGSGMAKETKIGLAVIMVILTAFGLIVYKKLNPTTPVAIAASEKDKKDDKKAGDADETKDDEKEIIAKTPQGDEDVPSQDEPGHTPTQDFFPQTTQNSTYGTDYGNTTQRQQPDGDNSFDPVQQTEPNPFEQNTDFANSPRQDQAQGLFDSADSNPTYEQSSRTGADYGTSSRDPSQTGFTQQTEPSTSNRFGSADTFDQTTQSNDQRSSNEASSETGDFNYTPDEVADVAKQWETSPTQTDSSNSFAQQNQSTQRYSARNEFEQSARQSNQAEQFEPFDNAQPFDQSATTDNSAQHWQTRQQPRRFDDTAQTDNTSDYNSGRNQFNAKNDSPAYQQSGIRPLDQTATQQRSFDDSSAQDSYQQQQSSDYSNSTADGSTSDYGTSGSTFGDSGSTYGNSKTTYGNSQQSTYGESNDADYGNSTDTTYGNSNDTSYGNSNETTYGNSADTNSWQPTSTSTTNSLEYEVQPGDNYWSISRKTYGTARYFRALELFNQRRIPDARKMRPGMKVMTPKSETLESAFPKLFPKTLASARQTTRESVTTTRRQPRPAQPAGFFRDQRGQPMYRIGRNDTLSEISQRHLGRATRWIQIFNLNRDVLKDPNALKLGAELRLPADASRVELVKRGQDYR